ncbi:MAG: hypothetical protein H2174_03415 [Vampirovibrio sp.]|jgi:hypothetical protein|nr:hypothetical protein [Vampirovibrio sp.]
MMMSAITPITASSPRLTSTALVASATGKKEPNSSSSNAKLGVIPPAPQALTNDVFAPSVSLKVPADAPASSSAATSETTETKTATKPSTTTTKSTTEVKPVDASPEKIEKAKTIMAETEAKFTTEKDPAKAKKLLNETYSQLKTLNLPKENLIVHAMQLDVWDAAIVNLLPANDKPVSVAVTATTTIASSEKQTPAKDSGKEASDKSVNVIA